MEKLTNKWENPRHTVTIRYTCGFCGTDTSPEYGLDSENIRGHRCFILLCTFCNRPSFLELQGDKIIAATPAHLMGNSVSGLPKDVGALYDEARKCTGIGAHTSAVLACRKILMHVAVEKGAKKKLSFQAYVNYLDENNHIPPGSKGWVDHIRSKSNEANHEIVLMSPVDADDLITFTEMLLRLMYEFPERLPRKTSRTAKKKRNLRPRQNSFQEKHFHNQAATHDAVAACASGRLDASAPDYVGLRMSAASEV